MICRYHIVYFVTILSCVLLLINSEDMINDKEVHDNIHASSYGFEFAKSISGDRYQKISIEFKNSSIDEALAETNYLMYYECPLLSLKICEIFLTTEIFFNHSTIQTLSIQESKIYFTKDATMPLNEILKNLTITKSLFELKELLEAFVDVELTYLNLNNNSITNLENNLFLGFVFLEVLDLSYNQIKGLERNTFRGLSNLKVLNLQYNEINLVSIDLLQFLYEKSFFQSIQRNNTWELMVDDTSLP